MTIRLYCNIVLLGLTAACTGGDETVAATSAPPTPSPKPASASSPAAIQKAPTVVRGISRPLKTLTPGLALVDRLDIANEQDEAAHKYKIQEPTFRGAREFELATENAAYVEDGRAMKLSESFQIKVVPNQDNFLIKAFDTLAKDQKVRVVVDGKSLGDWALPDGEANRYGEATFPLAASLIGNRSQLDVKIEYVSGSPDTNAFVYWVFAKPDRKLDMPVSTKLSGLTMTDRLDVGADEDEAAHEYVIDRSSYHGIQQFQWPASGLPFLENGRATKSYESFRMRAQPGKDHVLVKAFDTYSKKQTVRVLVNGNVVGDWNLPDGVPRYGEGSFRIPAKFIGAQNLVSVRVEFVSASVDANSFVYWMFAAPNEQTASN